MTEAQRRRLEERKKRMQEEAAADAASSKRPVPKKVEPAQSMADQYEEFLRRKNAVTGAFSERRVVEPQGKKPTPAKVQSGFSSSSGSFAKTPERKIADDAAVDFAKTAQSIRGNAAQGQYQKNLAQNLIHMYGTIGYEETEAQRPYMERAARQGQILHDILNHETQTEPEETEESILDKIWKGATSLSLINPAPLGKTAGEAIGKGLKTVFSPQSSPEAAKSESERMAEQYDLLAEIESLPMDIRNAVYGYTDTKRGVSMGDVFTWDVDASDALSFAFPAVDAVKANRYYKTILEYYGGDKDKVDALLSAHKSYQDRMRQQRQRETVQGDPVSMAALNLMAPGYAAIRGPIESLGVVGDSLSPVKSGNGSHFDMGDLVDYGKQATRQAIEGEDPNFWRKAAGYGYAGAMSAAENTVRNAAGIALGIPSASLGLMGTGSFAQGYRDAKERGATEAQAYAKGIADAAIEIATEKIPLDRWLNFEAKDLKTAIIDAFLISPGIEISTEEASYFGSILADAVIMGDRNQMSMDISALMSQGYTEEEAKKAVVKDLVGGAIDTAIETYISTGVSTGGKYLSGQGLSGQYEDMEAQETEVEGETLETATPETAVPETAEPSAKPETAQQRQAQQGAQADAESAGEQQPKRQEGKAKQFRPSAYGAPPQYKSVEEAARDIPTSMRGKFTELYDGTSDLTAYTKGWQALVLEGRQSVRNDNITLDNATKRWSSFTSAMSDDARIAAFAYGQTSEKGTGKPLVAGKVTFEGDETRLTPKQKTNLEGLRLVAEVLNVPVSVFESDAKPTTGVRVGANGWYDPKDGSIHIDLNAGADGAGTMLFTASHEVVHLIRDRAPKAYDALIKFLSEEYGTDLKSLVEAQQTKAERFVRFIGWEDALEEVVADSMETMLTDKDVVRRLNNLRNKDKNLWNRIKSFFSNLASRIQRAYKGLKPDSKEGKMVKGMLDKAQELRDLFVAGVEEAAKYKPDVASTERTDVNTENRVDSEGRSLSHEQAEYFRSSVVRDAKGRLKPVYHGSGAFFSQFTYEFIGKSGLFEGPGFYFTDNKTVADVYATGPEGKRGTENGKVYEVFVNITKPISNDSVTMSKETFIDFMAELYALAKDGTFPDIFGGTTSRVYANDLYAGANSDLDLIYAITQSALARKTDFNGEIGDAVMSMLRALNRIGGYDGTIVKNPAWGYGKKQSIYIAFFPEQIKYTDNQSPTKSADIRYSYAGERAATADRGRLAQAEELEKRGKSNEEIRQETGWFRGMDGKWRFEIDDSVSEFRRDGDAKLMEEPGYRRLQALTEKWAKLGGDLPDDESAEFDRLQEEYADRVWDEKYTLPDFLSHNELFGAYPQLRYASLVFEDLPGGVKGYYSKRSNTIVLSNDLIGAAESTLLHEIQHMIQHIEGFSPGTSPKAAGREAYRNTAGEIEARDTAQRRNLTAEQRKKTPPDLGDEKTVFADSSITLSKDISEYPYDMQTVIREYMDGVDAEVLNLVREVKNGTAWNGKTVQVASVDRRMAKEIANRTGVEIKAGTPILLKASGVTHIIKRHGEKGKANQSMKDDHDIARIGYVLQNFDFTTDDVRDTFAYTNRDGTASKTVIFAKKIDGTFFVVEATPDTGKVIVTSAYIQKKGTPQVRDANAPRSTAKTAPVSVPENRISQTSPTVNPESADGRKFSMRDSDEPDFTMSDSVDFTMAEEAPVTEGTEETPAEKPKKESKPLHNLTRIQRAIKPIAEGIKEKAGAKGDTGELRRLIEQAYADIARKKAPTMEDIQSAAEPAAQWVMEHTPAQLDPYAEAALAEMKGRKVKLNIHQKQEILRQYDSMAAFRKAIGGAIEIGDDGLELDVFFQEMAESYPGLFDQTVSDAQMGLELADLIDRLRNMESTDSAEASYYAEEIKADIVQQILDGYEETDVLKVVKERHRKEVEKLRQKQKDRVKKLRGEHKSKLAEERAKADKKVAATEKRAFAELAHKEERLARAEALVKGFREQQETYGLRSTVYRQARSLIRKLNENSKGQHVPAPLRKVLGEFAESLDLLSKASHTKGELTKADNRMVSSMEKLRGMLTAADSAEAKVFGNFVSIDGVILDIAPEVVGQLGPIIDSVNQALRQWSESGNEGNALYSMDKKQLDTLHEVLTQILTAVGNANTIFSGEAGRRTDVYAKSAIREYESMKVAKNEHAIDWNLMTPFFFFRRMGGAAAHIWEGFKKGMNKMARLRKQVEDFSKKTWKPKEIKAWQKKIITYKTEAGEEIQLTEAQVMSLYIASKREQAQLHMFDRGDGIRIGEIEQTGKANIVDKQNHKITSQDVANLVDMLSDKKRQLEVADAIQKFMSTVGAELGNEVTLKRWGIKRFGEEYYFPIKVVSGSKDVQADKIRNEQYRLLNLGMTKDTKEGVTEAMIIDGIFDVFADHMSEMIRYNSFALPILDAMRWINFTDRVSDGEGGTKKGQSVHGAMEKAFGKKAVGFFLDMVGALNSNKTGENDPTDKVTRFLNAMWKRSVIFHSLSTAVKQPLSYIRASYVLSPKYMTKAFGKIPDSKMKKEREQMYRENGIAEWKGQGYMDANMSRGMSDAFKQERTFGQRWEDAAMWLASKMDEITWTRLWIACKWQACRGDSKLYGAAETLAEAKRLFEDAIYGTQVVDSPLTRSQWSRNNNLFNSMFVPFSSEGNVAYNVMMDGVRLYGDEVRRTDRKTATKKYGGKIARGISVYMAGQVADAIVESLIAARRDDDEFKTYWEKFMEALLGEGVMQGDMLGLLGGNLFDSLNPLNNMANLQVITDSILSATKGYSNERTDTSSLVKLIELGKMWYEYAGIQNGTIDEPTELTGYGRKTLEGMVYDTLRYLDRIAGTGIGNIARSLVSTYNNVADVVNSMKEPGEKKMNHFVRYDGFTEKAVEQAYKDGYLTLQEAGQQIQEARAHNGKPEYTDNELYWVMKKLETGLSKNDGIDLAVLSGNRDDMKDAQSEIIEFSDKAPENPLSSAILRVYKDSLLPTEQRNKAYNGQTISRDEAYKLLTEVAGLADREAYAELEKAEYAVSTGSDTGFSVFSGVYDAMKTGGDIAAEVDKLVNEGYLESDIMSQVRGKITTAYKDGKLSKDETTRILGEYYGVTEQKELFQYFDKADHELAYGENYTVYRDVYKAVESGGSIDAAMKHLTDNGFTEAEVRKQAVDHVRDLYVKDGKITEAKASELLSKYGRTREDLSEAGKRAYLKEYGVIPKNGEYRNYTSNELFWKMDEWTWRKQNPNSEESYSKYTKWYGSVESGEKLRETIKYYEEHGVSKSALSGAISDKYKTPYIEAVLSGDREKARELRRAMIKAWSYLGYDTDQKLDDLAEWVATERKNRR